MKIYLLIIKYLIFILDSVFPKKQEDFSHKNIISIYQKFNILPSSYHTRYLLPYRNPYIKKAIWNFKYHKSKKEIKTFSDILSDELIAQVVDNVSTLPLRNPVPLLYPPSTSYILGKKSFDHMNILLENVCNLQNIEFPFFRVEHDVFEIREGIKPQHVSLRRERLNLSKEKYALKKKITSHTIICIDDVLTTGSTLKSINDQLKDRRIFNITLSG